MEIITNPFLSQKGYKDDDWGPDPTLSVSEIISYSILIPIICAFGCVGNTLSLLVLMRPCLKCPIFTYLAALATTSFLCTMIGLMGGICQQVLRKGPGNTFFFIMAVPISKIVETAKVFLITCITIDRVLHLGKSCYLQKWKVITQRRARWIVAVFVITSLLTNMPYFFLYNYEARGFMEPSPILYSRFYFLFNWVYFTFYTIFPAIILTTGNIYLCMKMMIIEKKREKLLNRPKRKRKSLSYTLILMIFCFLLSEVPGQLLAKVNYNNMLFNGNFNDKDSNLIESLRHIFAVIQSLYDSSNLFLYNYFCPAFRKQLHKLLYRRKERPLQITVFFINKKRPKATDVNDDKNSEVEEEARAEIAITERIEDNNYCDSWSDTEDLPCDTFYGNVLHIPKQILYNQVFPIL